MQEAKLHAVTGSSCKAILSTTLVFVILVSCRERYSNVTALQRPTHETYSDPKFALETGSNVCCVFVCRYMYPDSLGVLPLLLVVWKHARLGLRVMLKWLIHTSTTWKLAYMASEGTVFRG